MIKTRDQLPLTHVHLDATLRTNTVSDLPNEPAFNKAAIPSPPDAAVAEAAARNTAVSTIFSMLELFALETAQGLGRGGGARAGIRAAGRTEGHR